MTVEIRPRVAGDDSLITSLLRDSWGGTIVVSRGLRHDALQLPGFVAVDSGLLVGVVTYRIHQSSATARGHLEMEVITIDAAVRGRGIGSSLLRAALGQAVRVKCRRIWLITTNDNTAAQRFYARNGMTLAAVHVNAMERSRALKPEIPLFSDDGIAIRDELEYELLLDPTPERA
jgi:ribosomal protein S18 acetylase RimI-like enzyme